MATICRGLLHRLHPARTISSPFPVGLGACRQAGTASVSSKQGENTGIERKSDVIYTDQHFEIRNLAKKVRKNPLLPEDVEYNDLNRCFVSPKS
jgi:hypothetical protein